MANPNMSKSAMRRLRRKMKEEDDDDEDSSYCSSDEEEYVANIVVTSSHSIDSNGISEVHHTNGSSESKVAAPVAKPIEPVQQPAAVAKPPVVAKKVAPPAPPVVAPRGVAGDLLSMLLTSTPASTQQSTAALDSQYGSREVVQDQSTSSAGATKPGGYYQSKSGFTIRLE
jgi:hypothetical protein